MKPKIHRINPFGYLVEAQSKTSSPFELSIEEIRELLLDEALIVLRGFQNLSSAQNLVDFCEMFGEISLWPFGKVLELVEKKGAEDHIFDSSYVPLHWDGMYRPQVPHLQVFHCLLAPKTHQGGRTTFSHTQRVAKKASKEDLSLWKKVTGVYERKMEYYQSKTVAPILNKHPVSGALVIRYNEKVPNDDENFLNHPSLEFLGLTKDEEENFHLGLCRALYAPQNFYAHQWISGDIVIADNYTLLHGREAFHKGAPRHLRRVHVLGQPPLNNPHLVEHQ